MPKPLQKCESKLLNFRGNFLPDGPRWFVVRKTQYRLCRQLGRRGLWIKLVRSLSRMGSWRIKEDTLLVLDISDIAKKYAQRMEYLATVRDGSEGNFAHGYWTCSVIGTEAGESVFIPLYHRLYSQAGPDFISENAEVRKAISFVSEQTNNRGIWVLDRGGDRRKIIYHLLSAKHRFILRLKFDRHLLYRRKKRSVYEHALACPLLYRERIVKEDAGREKIYHLEFGCKPVKLPERKESLYMVVVRGFWSGADDVVDQYPSQQKPEIALVHHRILYDALADRGDDSFH